MTGLCYYGYVGDKISDVSQDTWDDKARNIFFYVFINVFMFPYELRRSMSVMLPIGSMICQAEVQIYFYFPLEVVPFGELHLMYEYIC